MVEEYPIRCWNVYFIDNRMYNTEKGKLHDISKYSSVLVVQLVPETNPTRKYLVKFVRKRN